jgi:hypothetical protein
VAKQNNPQITGSRTDVIKITDSKGNVIVEIGTKEYSIKNFDGSRTQRKITESMTLVCGTVWTALARFPVGVCEICREPPPFSRRRHGLVALSRARMCVDCGQLCCPSHRKIGKDQKWRCLRHHRQHLLKTLFRPIFFKREEE